MFKPLVGLCIVEVDGNPIPMRTVEKRLVQTHKTIFTQEIGACCSKVIEAFTEVVREDIAQGHEVRLMGFGTWNLREVASRKVKSIRGGHQITIPARMRVGFSVGAVLSQAAQTHAGKGTRKKTASAKVVQNAAKR